MKLRTSISPIRLRLGVLSKHLATATLGVRLQTVALSKRLVVAIGDFVRFLVFTDAASTADVLNRAISKPLSDSTTASESIGVVPNKQPLDGVATFDGELYFDEDYVVGAPLTPTYTLGAQISFAVSKVLAEVFAAASSGLLSIQNYTVDMSYFAEDYVGESRAFS